MPTRTPRPFTRVRRAVSDSKRSVDAVGERFSWPSLIAGLVVRRHFKGRYVVWEGGFPKPQVMNRGGDLWSGGCTLWSGVRLEVARGAVLSIGKGSYLNRNTLVICRERVTIGEGAMISWDVVIMDSDDHDGRSERPATMPVTIEDGAWIGCRAIILKGVTIGRGAVIGAGAIVTRDVPPYGVAVGQPARVIRNMRA